MTFKEKLAQEYPNKINENYDGCCEGCPRDYGYEQRHTRSDWCTSHTCLECWNREIPGYEEKPHILDSGERRQFETGAVRDIQEGKGRCDLMPLEVLCKYFKKPIFGLLGMFLKDGNTAHLYECIRLFSSYYGEETNTTTDYTMFLEVAKHFEEGAKKYGENNWQKGLPMYCYIDSAVRHYLKWLRGDKDEPHDRAFVWNVLCCIWECDFSSRATKGTKHDAPVMVLEHVAKARPNQVLYLCDRLACPACDNPECSYTEDIKHAANFESVESAGAAGGHRYVERCNSRLLLKNADPGVYELFGFPCLKGCDSAVYDMATGCSINVTSLTYAEKKLSLVNWYLGAKGLILGTAPGGALFYHEDNVWLRTTMTYADDGSVYAVRLCDGQAECISGNTLVTCVEDVDLK